MGSWPVVKCISSMPATAAFTQARRQRRSGLIRRASWACASLSPPSLQAGQLLPPTVAAAAEPGVVLSRGLGTLRGAAGAGRGPLRKRGEGCPSADRLRPTPSGRSISGLLPSETGSP